MRRRAVVAVVVLAVALTAPTAAQGTSPAAGVIELA